MCVIIESVPQAWAQCPRRTRWREFPCSRGQAHSTSTTDQAALLMNLLPQAGESLLPARDGVYVGDGIPPVPAKLATKIRRGEFIDMGELLPEFWSAQDDGEARKESKQRRSRKVTDMFTWLQCYASYVAVRVLEDPRMAPELLAYQSTIVRVIIIITVRFL